MSSNVYIATRTVAVAKTAGNPHRAPSRQANALSLRAAGRSNPDRPTHGPELPRRSTPRKDAKSAVLVGRCDEAVSGGLSVTASRRTQQPGSTHGPELPRRCAPRKDAKGISKHSRRPF
jgi:hypothetical protein